MIRKTKPAPRRLKLIPVFIAAFWAVSGAAAQSTKSIEVPFEFVHNQIVVQVKIGGKGPFRMLFDTNTDPSTIDAATANELGLQVGSKGYTATGGGTEQNTIHATRLQNVEVGGVMAREVAAATIDLTKLSQKMGTTIQGVLGYSFLKDRIVQIDYPNLKLRFYTESPYPAIRYAPNAVNAAAFPLRHEDGEVIIDPVYVNDQKMRAALDTGSSGTFSVTPEAVAALGLKPQAGDAGNATSAGYNGEYQSESGLLKSVRLGRLAVESVPAQLWLPGTGFDKKKFQINIGNGFFQDFVVTFDFKNKMVVLERVD